MGGNDARASPAIRAHAGAPYQCALETTWFPYAVCACAEPMTRKIVDSSGGGSYGSSRHTRVGY
jgi:hypothetical protein